MSAGNNTGRKGSWSPEEERLREVLRHRSPQQRILLVEGQTDAVIVDALLENAGIRRVEILVTGGRRTLHGLLQELPLQGIAVLIDADEPTVPDAIDWAKNNAQLHGATAQIYVAIPSVDAWLLADPNGVARFAEPLGAERLRRMPPAESITYPKHVLSNVLPRSVDRREVARSINLDVARQRSASLSVFLDGMARFSGMPPEQRAYAGVESEAIRQVVVRLMRETHHAALPVLSTLDGGIVDAEQMIAEVETGTTLGREYVSAILRLARDLLAAEAVRKGNQ